jgi:hypothetical protein
MFLMWIPGCSSLIFQLLQDGHIRNEDNSAWRPRYSTDNYQWEVGRSNTSHRVIFLISWHPPPSITNPFSTNLPTREHFQCHSTKYLWIWGPSRPRVAAAAERTVAEDKEISDKLDEVGLGVRLWWKWYHLTVLGSETMENSWVIHLELCNTLK